MKLILTILTVLVLSSISYSQEYEDIVDIGRLKINLDSMMAHLHMIEGKNEHVYIKRSKDLENLKIDINGVYCYPINSNRSRVYNLKSQIVLEKINDQGCYDVKVKLKLVSRPNRGNPENVRATIVNPDSYMFDIITGSYIRTVINDTFYRQSFIKSCK